MKIEKVENLNVIEEKLGKIYEKEDAKNGVDFNFEDFTYAVKDDNNELLGGIHGWRVFKEIYIDEIAIDESARGQGIGKNLLDIVEKEMSNEKTDFMILHTNVFQGAVDFYKKMGFEIEFIRKNNNDSKYDKYYMIKRLK